MSVELEVIKAHSPIGASSMYRWKNCPGSVRMCEGLEQKSNPYAEEGTKAHEAAEYFLRTGLWPADVAPEMIEALEVYTGYIQDEILKATAQGDVEIFIEHRFHLVKIHPNLFGTADFVLYSRKDKVLKVIDLKFGSGVAVEAFNNDQLLYYAAGALFTLDLPCVQVEMVIVQPRCSHPDGPIRSWTLPAVDMLDFAADLKMYAERTEKPDAEIVPGDHCRWCLAAKTCPALQKSVEIAVQNEFSKVLSYDPATLSNSLKWIPQVEAWIKAVREFAYTEAMQGRCPPGFKLVPKRATRKWIDEAAVAKAIESHPAFAQAFTAPEIKSPAQLEKVLKKDFHIVSDLVVQESSGFNLAPASDEREAVEAGAQAHFDEIKPTE